MVFCGELAYKLSCYDKRLLVGKANLLAGLYCVDGRVKSGETHHSRKHHVYRLCLDYLVQCLLSGVDLYFGTVGKQAFQLVILIFVGYDYCRGIELACLSGQQLHLVICRKAVRLVQVGMLLYDFKCLRSYRTRRAEDGYLLFHISVVMHI